MALPVLEVKNLAYWYPDTAEPVWQEVNFSLERGELVLLAGCCGSGKSTLLKCLSGVIPYLLEGRLDGEVLVAGKKYEGISPSEIIRHVGVVWQNVEAQILQQYVEDELVFGLENLACTPEEMDERLARILPLVQLERNTPVSSLSGGQKQRLIIGSILSMQPAVLLLDEPLANLDPPAVNRLMLFLQGLCRSGTAILMAEHRLELALPFAHRVIHLEGGKALTRTVINFAGEHNHTGVSCSDTIINDAGKGQTNKQCDNQNVEQKDTGKHQTTTVLEIEGLNVSYRNRVVLQELNLKIEAGERVVILGHNGSGKSTLLKTLCGIKGDSTVKFKRFQLNGKDIRKLPANLARGTGLVMQNPHHQLFMDSVYREVAFSSDDDCMVNDILHLFGLQDFAQRHPFSLSQGQKRLLAVAAALSHHPRLLLLDEPTIGQDYVSLGRMLGVLKHISSTWNIAILTATHDRWATEQLADRVVLLEQGKRCLSGGRELIEVYFTGSQAPGFPRNT